MQLPTTTETEVLKTTVHTIETAVPRTAVHTVAAAVTPEDREVTTIQAAVEDPATEEDKMESDDICREAKEL